MPKSKTIDDIKRGYQDRVQYVGETQRVRLAPGDYSPLSAGVLIFIVVSVFCFLAYHMSIEHFGLPDPGVYIKYALAFGIGLTAGVSNFRYTRDGFEQGRWDLVRDKPNGTLQLPAVGTSEKTTLIQLDSIERLQLRTVIKPDPSEGTKGLYRLSVVCHHQFGNPDEAISREEFTDHAVAQSRDEFQLKAMGSWLEDLLEMQLDIDEVDADFSLVSTFRELTASK